MTVLAAVVGRGVTVAITLLTVPLTLGYLGAERYGMWVTASSVIALLGFADLGVGYGLLNAATRSTALGRLDDLRREVSSAFAILLLVAGLLALLYAALEVHIPWPSIFSVSTPPAAAEARPTAAVCIAMFLVSLPVNGATQLRFARQEGYLVHLATSAGGLASVGALLIAIATSQGLPVLALAMGGPPIAASAINGFLLFRAERSLMPSVALVDLRTGATMVRAGLLFFVLQLSMVVAFSSDSIVVAQVLGASAVPEYAVPFRFFSIPVALTAMALAPLWPAYGEAIARGDVDWVRRTLAAVTKGAFGFSLVTAVILTLTGGWVIEMWVGGRISPSIPLLIGFGIWMVQSAVGNSIAMLLNGANELRFQAAAAAAMAVLNVVASIWLTQQIGVAGVVWGTVVTYAALVLLPMAFYLPGVLARIEKSATRSEANANTLADH
jgi:O-antigen/teichoic acid export membrane protein